MWGLDSCGPWQEWPHSEPPCHAALTRLGDAPGVVALLGSAQAGPRGRYSVVGTPRAMRLLAPGAQSVVQAIDARPRDALRVLALAYELGAPGVFLPHRSPPRHQPAGLALDLGDGIIVDHTRRRYRRFGGSLPWDPSGPPRAIREAVRARLEPTVSDHEHSQRIRRCLAHIGAGDIYQANLSRRLRLDRQIHGPSAAIQLMERNPVAHGAFIRAPGLELCSNTMETLLTYEPTTGLACSFPIKGTRGRSPDLREDAALAELLAADPKERAEHVMIVDLVRNDLGRVAIPGSVHVPKLMHLEAFRGVWHGVSTVSAVLSPTATLGQLGASLFPGGSITGAPKRRAMQIIDDLEQEPRGFYTGSVALLAPAGKLSMSILIRTLVRDTAGWSLTVGGGIVADSRPQREIDETWEKAAVFQELLAGPPMSSVVGEGRWASTRTVMVGQRD